ncbi:hypothetical protein LZC95_02500 [Pendulispora brunnea]|uniref:Uncharacterized protein n=1 Tax=Pendulispora brunnea TaxID=2905690 RepID=A0ABZ2KAP8_9BACT
MRNALFAMFTVTALMASWTGCSSGGSDNGDRRPIGNVGANGGTVSAAGITLRVPPGAVDHDVAVSITRLADPAPAGFVARSPLYRFEPAGLQFRVPAEVEFALDGAAGDAGVFWSDTGDSFSARPSTVEGATVRATVEHFSVGFAGTRRTAADSGTPSDAGAVVCEAPRADFFAAGNPGAIVWNGDGYGAIWYIGGTAQSGLHFVRLDPAGQRVGEPVRLGDIRSFKLVATPNGYGLLRSTPNGLLLTRLDSTGHAIGADVTVSTGSSGDDIDLSFEANEFGVAWQAYRDGAYVISQARYDADGQKVGTSVVIRSLSSTAFSPKLAFSGNEYGVVWQDRRDDSNGEIYFARVDGNGQKTEVRLTNDGGLASGSPEIRWLGTYFGVLYFQKAGDANQLRFARLNAAGQRLGDDVTVANAGTYATASAVWTGSKLGVSFGQADGQLGLYQLDARGNVLGAGLSVAKGYDSSLAWTGSGYRLLWSSLEANQNIVVRISPLLCPP